MMTYDEIMKEVKGRVKECEPLWNIQHVCISIGEIGISMIIAAFLAGVIETMSIGWEKIQESAFAMGFYNFTMVFIGVGIAAAIIASVIYNIADRELHEIERSWNE